MYLYVTCMLQERTWTVAKSVEPVQNGEINEWNMEEN